MSLVNSEFSPDDSYYDNVRPSLVTLLPDRVDSVLDIGCGRGAYLRICRKRGAKRLVGVELRTEVARALRDEGWVEVIASPIEDADLSNYVGAFDVILASFVFEHVADPWTVLRSLRPLLRPGGRLIGSLPNFRYFRVSLPLVLYGRLRWETDGIMDRTHLRMFTRSSMLAMFADCGFRCARIEPEIGGRKREILSRATGGFFDGLAAWAYNFVIEPTEGSGTNGQSV